MQAISGSISLSLPATEAGGLSELSLEAGADMASGLGFLALFITQINSATSDPEAKLKLSDLLKGDPGNSDLDGKVIPQGLPLRPLISELKQQQDSMLNKILSDIDIVGAQLVRSGEPLIEVGEQLAKSRELLVKGGEQLAKSGELLIKGGDQLIDNKQLANTSNDVFSSRALLEAVSTESKPDSSSQSILQELGSVAFRGKGTQTLSTGSAAISSQLRDQGWGNELVSRVKWQIGREIQEVKINLNPRELGPLQVKINIIDDQAHVQFMTHNGSVREAIEDAIPRLREMLEQTGLSLADASVEQHSPDQKQAFSEQDDVTEEQSQTNNADNEEQENKVVRTGEGLVDAYI